MNCPQALFCCRMSWWWLGFGIFVAVVGAATGARSTPSHASCNVTWTLGEKCENVADRLVKQMEVWMTEDNCGTGQKCLYTFGSYEGNRLTGIHTTPKARYIDDLEFNFYPNSESGGCKLQGFSTSRTVYAILDYGTNYCNLHNLVEGSGFMADPKYLEETRGEICTQYDSANCLKY